VTAALVVLTAAAVVLVAALASALVGVAGVAGRGLLRRLDAGSRLRVLTAAAVAPGAVALVAVAASFASSLLAGIDHCTAHADHHPHLCVAHARLEHGHLLAVVIGLAATRWVFAAASAAARTWRSWRTERALAAIGAGSGVARIVDGMPPFAATIGWRRPRAYVSAQVPPDLRKVVIAHELSHVRNRDPAARALADVALAFHLPGVAGWLRHALHAAQEARADADAAREIGDPLAVADALVRFARLRPIPVGGATAGFEGDVASRVEELLDARRRSVLGAHWIVAAAVACTAGLLATSHDVHHAVETVLGLLGR